MWPRGFKETLENTLEVLYVLGLRGRHETKAEVSQHKVDESLKVLHRIAQLKCHPIEFEKSERCENCSFWNIFGSHKALMICLG